MELGMEMDLPEKDLGKVLELVMELEKDLPDQMEGLV